MWIFYQPAAGEQYDVFCEGHWFPHTDNMNIRRK
jgi:hypothetical protein